MTCEEIISRAAYDIGDEKYKDISKEEYLKMLRRTYRDFCEKTKILRNVITFTTVDANAYQLYGIDQNSRIFGDNFLGTYRVEFDGHKAYETDLDTLKDSHLHSGSDAVDQFGGLIHHKEVFYSIQYKQDTLWMIFKNNTTVGKTITVYYYELPKITDLTDFTDSPQFDIKYHDKLVLGLEAEAWERKYTLSLAKGGESYFAVEYLKIIGNERERTKALWKASMELVHQEVMALKDDTIPLVVVPATAFDFVFDDVNDEIDESLF